MVLKKVVYSVLVIVVTAILVQIHCREPIHIPDIADIIQETQPAYALDRGHPCTINVQKDLPNISQPLYLVPETAEIWQPDSEGYLRIENGRSIEFYCSKSFANVTGQQIPKNKRSIMLTCLWNNTLLLKGKHFKFHEFTCVQPPRFTVEPLGVKCGTNVTGLMYRVGFNITSTRFIETMRICFDPTVLRTHYVQYVLRPGNIHFQRSVKRVDFTKAGYFGDIDMKFLYTKINQQNVASKLLADSYSRFFSDKIGFLNRGHLAARADMIYASLQRATFNYHNVAPQWQSFNGGQWATLEDRMRKLVANKNVDVDCYTGTFGTLELPTLDDKQKRELYLTFDYNNNGLIPVPKFFYRVIVTRGEGLRRGIAIVGINNPHVTMHEINVDYRICDGIQEQVPYLAWISNKNLKQGYMYACRVDQLAAVVGHLPEHLSRVNELF